MTAVTNMPFRQQPVRPVPDLRKLAGNLLRFTHVRRIFFSATFIQYPQLRYNSLFFTVSRKWTGRIAEERSEDGESRRERSFHFRWRWETRDCGVLYGFVFCVWCVCVYGMDASNLWMLLASDASDRKCSMVFVRRKCTMSVMGIFFIIIIDSLLLFVFCKWQIDRSINLCYFF